MEIFIEYIETTNKERKEGEKMQKRLFPRASDSMTEETLKRYLFGENFVEFQDLISEKLQKHDDGIRQILLNMNPTNPSEFPLINLRDFWLELSTLINCIMVKAGTEHVIG